jgi:tRNA dimethylallyltransferase
MNHPFNLIVILGPTATGKTKLAAQLAYELNGEIISADSRQIYRRMDIGTGKDYKDYIVNNKTIPYHLIDIAEPAEEYNLFRFREDFYKTFDEIKNRGKVPFLAGGTGLYIDAILKNYDLKKASIDPGEYDQLNAEDINTLREKLLSMAPALHNTSDLKDKERIIQRIIVLKSRIDSRKNFSVTDVGSKVNSFVIGIKLERAIVRARITQRLDERLKSGMIEEVEALVKEGISFEKLDYFGLEYRFVGEYVAGKTTYDEMFEKLNHAIHRFSKRQMTWFRKMEREGTVIHWINGPDFNEAMELLCSAGFKGTAG